MEVTLEKIELVKDRTGVSYKEAKDALEAADGSVVDAIIDIEDRIDGSAASEKKNFDPQSTQILDAIKDLIKKGNVSKIVVKKSDGEVLLNLPVNAGIIAAIIAPWGILAGVLSTFAFKCVVDVVKDDGTILDVSAQTNEAVGKAVEKGSDLVGSMKQKSNETVDKLKDNETISKVMDKAGSTIDKTQKAIKDKVQKAGDEIEDVVQDIEDAAADMTDTDKNSK